MDRLAIRTVVKTGLLILVALLCWAIGSRGSFPRWAGLSLSFLSFLYVARDWFSKPRSAGESIE